MINKTNKCKYCNKKGMYSFGIVLNKGQWKNRHLTCEDHALCSSLQQQLDVSLMSIRKLNRDTMPVTRCLV